LSVHLRYTDSDYLFDTLCLQALLAVNYDSFNVEVLCIGSPTGFWVVLFIKL
jgi:hypothetical protein